MPLPLPPSKHVNTRKLLASEVVVLPRTSSSEQLDVSCALNVARDAAIVPLTSFVARVKCVAERIS